MTDATPTQTMVQTIEQLKDNSEWWQERAQSLEERIAELEGKTRTAETERAERDAAFELKAKGELQRARAHAIRALVKLLPEAIR